MRISEVKRRARVAEWAQTIGSRQESGLSIKAWCEAHGIRDSQYYYWLKIIRSLAIEQAEQVGQTGQGMALMKVEPEQLASSAPASPTDGVNEQRGITMRYGKATVEFPAGTPASVIAEMLKALTVHD